MASARMRVMVSVGPPAAPEAMSVKKQLSSEKLSSEEPNSEKLDNEPNKDLMHPSQSVAPPKLQSAVLSQSDSHRV
jgi:hypothetical protein